jgi:hypothetical protein
MRQRESSLCTSRGSNPDHRILSPVLSPLKVLVRVTHPDRKSHAGKSAYPVT